jgi:hypothetical protein
MASLNTALMTRCTRAIRLAPKPLAAYPGDDLLDLHPAYRPGLPVAG